MTTIVRIATAAAVSALAAACTTTTDTRYADVPATEWPSYNAIRSMHD